MNRKAYWRTLADKFWATSLALALCSGAGGARPAAAATTPALAAAPTAPAGPGSAAIRAGQPQTPLAAFAAWRAAEAAEASGGASAQASRAALSDGVMVLGWPGMEGAGRVCAQLSLQLAAAGQNARAAAYAQMAQRLAPAHLDGEVAHVAQAWRDDGAVVAGLAALHAVGSLLEAGPRRSALASHLAILVGWAAVVAVAVGAMAALWSVRPAWRRLVAARPLARMPTLLPMAAATAAVVFVAARPGPWVCACACAAVAGPCLGRGRRLVLGGAMGLVVAYWLLLPNLTPAFGLDHARASLRQAALTDATAKDLHGELVAAPAAGPEDLWAQGLLRGYAGEAKAAVDLLARAQRGGSNHADLWCALGNAHWRLHRPDQAQAAFAMARELDPRHAAAAYNLGVLELAAVRPELAQRWRQEAFFLAPQQVLAMASLAATEVMDPKPPAALFAAAADPQASAAAVTVLWAVVGGGLGLQGSLLVGFWAAVWVLFAPWTYARSWPRWAAELTAAAAEPPPVGDALHSRAVGLLVPGSLGIAGGRAIQAYVGLFLSALAGLLLAQDAGLLPVAVPVYGVDFFALQRPLWLCLHGAIALVGLLVAYGSGGWEDG